MAKQPHTNDIRIIRGAGESAQKSENELLDAGYRFYDENEQGRFYKKEKPLPRQQGQQFALDAQAYLDENPTVDVTGLKGSGPGGIIRRSDVEAHHRGQARTAKKEEEKK